MSGREKKETGGSRKTAAEKADQLAKEKISAQIKSIRREIRDTEDQKNQLGEQEDAFRMNEESNGYFH